MQKTRKTYVTGFFCVFINVIENTIENDCAHELLYADYAVRIVFSHAKYWPPHPRKILPWHVRILAKNKDYDTELYKNK